MFCPSCGAEERQSSQFCRACGTDMRTVRTALQKPDSITASAVSARDEIGRAIASKIQEIQTARELKKVVEDVLPEIEKFLESPEERRMRRLRNGVITAAAGLGATLFLILEPHFKIFDLGWPAGLLVFLIGIGIVINGLLFSRPVKFVADRSQDAQSQKMLDQISQPQAIAPPEMPQYLSPPPSITEETTRQLPDKVAVPIKRTTSELAK